MAPSSACHSWRAIITRLPAECLDYFILFHTNVYFFEIIPSRLGFGRCSVDKVCWHRPPHRTEYGANERGYDEPLTITDQIEEFSCHRNPNTITALIATSKAMIPARQVSANTLPPR